MLRLLLIVAVLWTKPLMASPAVWEVRGPQATVYLLGSIRMIKPGTAWESPAIDLVIAESREFWFEIDFFSGDRICAFTATLLTGLDLRHTLSHELSTAASARLHDLFGDGVSRLEPISPWLALIMVSLQEWTVAGDSADSGVDVSIRRMAVAGACRCMVSRAADPNCA